MFFRYMLSEDQAIAQCEVSNIGLNQASITNLILHVKSQDRRGLPKAAL